MTISKEHIAEVKHRVAWCDKFTLDPANAVTIKLDASGRELISRTQRLVNSTRLMESVDQLVMTPDGTTITAHISPDEHLVFESYALNVWRGYT